MHNPLMWADVPDEDVIRVGDYYYMTSTSMHMMPGVPIMRSTDLANWEIVSYVYDTLEDNDGHNLTNGKNIYGKGSWATSLRYHNGIFYVCFGCYDIDRTYIYKTNDIEKGLWQRSVFKGVYHDPSLMFDDDSKVYMVYGAGDIRIRELTEEATAFKAGGVNKLIISTSKGNIVNAEGSHIYKINGTYYIFLIQWPKTGTSRRIEWCYRSKDLLGEYDGRIVLDDNLGYSRNHGVAQGGIFDTVDGYWYAMLFQDHDAVGRIPVLVPVTWSEGWPIMGVNGKVPAQMVNPLSTSPRRTELLVSDEFTQTKLGLTWQWNHNPDNSSWSLTRRPGYLRLATGSIAGNILQARNTLTQRTVGPTCSGEVALEFENMKPGDYAGLAAFQNAYGMIGVKVSLDGKKYVVMATNGGNGDPEEIGLLPICQDRVYLRITFDFVDSHDLAYFCYSLDGMKWTRLGDALAMRYTLDHFMGYRIALYNYATVSTGGFVDFEYFHAATPAKNL